jgi:hypothetical protein
MRFISVSILLFLFSTLLDRAAAFNPGMTATLDYNIFNEAKLVYTNLIIEAIRKVKIPDQKFDHGEVTGCSFSLADVSPDQIVVSPNEEENSLVLTISRIAGQFKAENFRLTASSYIGTHGSLQVDMSNVKLTIGAQLST